MDTNDMMKKAQEMLGNVSDEQIDEYAEQLKGKTPDNMDDKVDMAADFLKDHNDK
ncbi:hypothetical protein [Demequina sp.]|uniref:hypothetical protein n=1 Tax=Demequina sp. TaxID=2050685 RepID=UPI003D15248B